MLRVLQLFAVTFAETLALRARRGPARPSWSFAFEGVIAFLRRDHESTATWSYPRLRADWERRPMPGGAVRRVERHPETLGGVPGVWFVPREIRRGGVLLYFHGGSYLFGSTRTHADLIARLALAAGVRTFAIDYRLAPEHPYPAALEDALAAFEGLVTSGVAPAQIVVAGDSAGGNLALVVQLARRDRGLPQAGAAVLFSPWLDLTASRASCRANDSVDWGSREMLLRHARDFTGGIPLDDPRVSPLGAELAGLAPLLLVVGDAERLFDEGVELAARARAAGVDATLEVLGEMPHNGPLFADYHPEGRRGLERAGAFIASRLPAWGAAGAR